MGINNGQGFFFKRSGGLKAEKTIEKTVPISPESDEIVHLFSPEPLIQSQREIIERIGNALGFDGIKKEVLIYSVIRRLIEKIHLIPASESHHHSESGGLLRHSLEVALYSVNYSSSSSFASQKGTVAKNDLKTVYPYLSFLLALLHDIGKAYHDIRVLSIDSMHEMNPYTETIFEFCRKNNASSYIYRFNKSRINRFHEKIMPFIIPSILTYEVLDFITVNSTTKTAMDDFLMAISDSSILQSNEAKYLDARTLLENLKKADSRSVKRYVLGHITLFGSDGKRLDKFGMLCKLISVLVDLKAISVNKPKSSLFSLENDMVLFSITREFLIPYVELVEESEAPLPKSQSGLEEFLNKESAILRGSNEDAESYLMLEIIDEPTGEAIQLPAVGFIFKKSLLDSSIKEYASMKILENESEEPEPEESKVEETEIEESKVEETEIEKPKIEESKIEKPETEEPETEEPETEEPETEEPETEEPETEEPEIEESKPEESISLTEAFDLLEEENLSNDEEDGSNWFYSPKKEQTQTKESVLVKKQEVTESNKASTKQDESEEKVRIYILNALRTNSDGISVSLLEQSVKKEFNIPKYKIRNLIDKYAIVENGRYKFREES
jgi:hypothetical protein